MKLYQADGVHVEEVIICTKKRRGTGKEDPIRIITEVFTKDGELIAEYDPFLTRSYLIDLNKQTV